MSRLLTLSFLVWLGLSVCLVVSCGDDDDEDGGNDDNQEAFNTCEETTTALAGLDVVSDLLGISAADLLDTAGNGFTSAANYTDDTSILTQSPLGGETMLMVTITYDGGEIREIESQPAEDGTGQEIAVECLHRLEIDVTVDFSTEDGAFEETWLAVLTQSLAAEGNGLANPFLSADFDPAGIEGSYEILSITGPTPDSVTGAFYTTAVYPFQGSVDILVEQTQGEGDEGTVSQTRHIALYWGAEQP